MRRRDLITAAAGALVATVLAGGVAWAAIPSGGGVYTACMLKNIGTVRLIDKSLPANNLMSHCKPALEVEISWNQQGQSGPQGMQGPPGANGDDGTDGAGPTVAPVAAGDPNCPAGGAAITDAAGSTAYVCSGRDGADGEPFAGTFTSPNGEYSISVTDTGISLAKGPTTRISIQGDDVIVRAAQNLDARASFHANLQAGGFLDLRAQALVRVNGDATPCQLAARMSDAVMVVPATGVGAITGGSSRVCIG